MCPKEFVERRVVPQTPGRCQTTRTSRSPSAAMRETCGLVEPWCHWSATGQDRPRRAEQASTRRSLRVLQSMYRGPRPAADPGSSNPGPSGELMNAAAARERMGRECLARVAGEILRKRDRFEPCVRRQTVVERVQERPTVVGVSAPRVLAVEHDRQHVVVVCRQSVENRVSTARRKSCTAASGSVYCP